MDSIDTIALRRSGLRLPRSGVLQLLSALLTLGIAWYHTGRTRKQLSKLSDEALRDLGLTRSAAEEEALRPFWDSRATDIFRPW
ncbi:DUF1127 domain-containing protein [Roseibium sp.]|uniref:DUF1127 domain-containing protein n=1 Tax=Roseibium sp. TaxID=1936156 RepID=UPI003A982BC2